MCLSTLTEFDCPVKLLFLTRFFARESSSALLLSMRRISRQLPFLLKIAQSQRRLY